MSWTFIYLMVFLKLPIAGLLWLVWWAVHQTTEEPAGSSDDDGRQQDPVTVPTAPAPAVAKPAPARPAREPPAAGTGPRENRPGPGAQGRAVVAQGRR